MQLDRNYTWLENAYETVKQNNNKLELKILELNAALEKKNKELKEMEALLKEATSNTKTHNPTWKNYIEK